MDGEGTVLRGKEARRRSKAQNCNGVATTGSQCDGTGLHSNDGTALARRSTAADGTEVSGFAKAMRRPERRRHSKDSLATAKLGTESKGIELR